MSMHSNSSIQNHHEVMKTSLIASVADAIVSPVSSAPSFCGIFVEGDGRRSDKIAGKTIFNLQSEIISDKHLRIRDSSSS